MKTVDDKHFRYWGKTINYFKSVSLLSAGKSNKVIINIYYIDWYSISRFTVFGGGGEDWVQRLKYLETTLTQPWHKAAQALLKEQ